MAAAIFFFWVDSERRGTTDPQAGSAGEVIGGWSGFQAHLRLKIMELLEKETRSELLNGELSHFRKRNLGTSSGSKVV